MTTQSEFLGRLLIAGGIALVIVGALVLWARWLRLGSLPGDFTWTGKGWQVSFPIATCLVLSLVLTLILNLVMRRR